MNIELMGALDQLEEEKGISKDVLIDAIETALVTAYKHNFDNSASVANQEVRVSVDKETGKITVYAEKKVVDSVEDPNTEISLEDAKKVNEAYETGDTLEVDVTPSSFGRIAAQTAKQVVVQRIREAERGVIYEHYIDREGELVAGVIQRQEHGSYYVDLGKAEAILPRSEAVQYERYEQGKRMKFYVLEVRNTTKGPQIVVSRSHPGLIKRLFELEVPEISSNVVVIKNIAREAGQRTKISVYAEDPNIDPIGACVGPRGSRIERIVDEIGNERIDVIPYSSEPAEYIANALRPAKVIMSQVNPDDQEAKVIVPDQQLSLAIGKEGQNARLAAKLTGYRIGINYRSYIVGDIVNDDV